MKYPVMENDQAKAEQEIPRGSGEKGVLDYSKIPAGENEIVSLAEKGDFKAWAEKVRAELKGMGASDRDLGMISYFEDVAREATNPGNDPALRGWAVKLGNWVLDTKKKALKGGKGK